MGRISYSVHYNIKFIGTYFEFLNSFFMIFFLVLGLTRDSPKSDIGKTYRKLAGKFHPDRFRSAEDKADAEKKFMQIASA